MEIRLLGPEIGGEFFQLAELALLGSRDDAAALALDDGRSVLLATTDFFMPIVDDPEQFELLRQAVTSLVRVQRTIREFPIPDDQEPAIALRRD